MSASTIPKFDKPKSITLEHIPDSLESKLNSYDRIKLLSGKGNVIVKYKNIGTLLVSNVLDKDVLTLTNPSPVVVMEIVYPLAITLHESDVIQLVNVETGEIEKFQQEKDTLKKVQALLLDRERMFGITANKVFIWNLQNLRAAPVSLNLVDARDSNNKPLINVKHAFSKAISPSRLLLANPDQFQVWDLDKDKQEMWIAYEGKNPDIHKKFFSLDLYYPTVMATQQKSVLVWDLALSVEPYVHNLEALLTSSYMDDTFIIIGDNFGALTLRQRKDGEKLWQLNNTDDKKQTPPVDRNITTSLLEVDVGRRINCVEKIGRWVFVGTENSRLLVFDITKVKADPVLTYEHVKGGAVRGILVENNVVIVAFSETSAKDKEKTTKSKGLKKLPELVFWTPKLPGLEFYSEKKREGGANITMLLSYSYKQISSYLLGIEKAGEDVTEFSTTADRVDTIIDRIRFKPYLDIQFVILKDLQAALDDYEALLEKLTQQGSLMRFFTSSRLRRDIEFKNSALHKRLKYVEETIQGQEASFINLEEQKKAQQTQETTGAAPAVDTEASSSPRGVLPPTSSEYISTDVALQRKNIFARESMIEDLEARTFWQNNFGDVMMVDWAEFSRALSSFMTLSETDEKVLINILDHANTGLISQYKFSESLKGFGPLSKLLENVNNIINQEWFHGYLSSREAELLLKITRAPDGSFLVRFSKSKPGSFALAFIKSGSVKHIIIESALPDGFRILEKESGQIKVFKSLHEIIEHYSFVLKHPFVSNIPKQPWFHGDLTNDEASHALSSEQDGSFLIRFSSKSTFAATYVYKAQARHVLITNDAVGRYVVNTGPTGADTLTFQSLDELVQHYYNNNIFKVPFVGTNKSFTFS